MPTKEELLKEVLALRAEKMRLMMQVDELTKQLEQVEKEFFTLKYRTEQ